MLAKGEALPPQYHDHAPTGDMEGTRDCHITPDRLLLYRIENDILVLTGTLCTMIFQGTASINHKPRRN